MSDNEKNKNEQETQKLSKGTPRKRISREERERLMVLGKQHIDQDFIDENFKYRLVNDKLGRVAHLERLGYEIVLDDSGHRVERPSDTDKNASSSTAILMRIPKEDYEDIQAIKRKRIHELKKTTQADKAQGFYGPGLSESIEKVKVEK